MESIDVTHPLFVAELVESFSLVSKEGEGRGERPLSLPLMPLLLLTRSATMRGQLPNPI